jgi:hypothetical protein
LFQFSLNVSNSASVIHYTVTYLWKASTT